MSNGKRWTLYGADGLYTILAAGGPVLQSGESVRVMPVSEHNADLESLARELEGRAEAENEMRRKCLPIGERRLLHDPVGVAVHAAGRDAYREAAQLVRAKIEEGGK